MKFLLFILLTFSTLCCYGEASYSGYFIKGIIIDKDNKPMPNARFTVMGCNPPREFVTDDKGAFFVQVMYYIPCLSGRISGSGDQRAIDIIREANGDILTITCPAGSKKIKFNWAQHYRKNRGTVELVNIKLDEPVVSPDSIYKVYERHERVAESMARMKELSQLPIDTFKAAARIKRDAESWPWILPDGTKVSLDGEDPPLKKTLLWKCYMSRHSMDGYMNIAFENNEVRNLHIDRILPDLLGNFRELFVMEKEKNNVYVLTKASFGKEYGYYTFYTNDAGYIVDMTQQYDEY